MPDDLSTRGEFRNGYWHWFHWVIDLHAVPPLRPGEGEETAGGLGGEAAVSVSSHSCILDYDATKDLPWRGKVINSTRTWQVAAQTMADAIRFADRHASDYTTYLTPRANAQGIIEQTIRI
jgi:hypothetical protein